MIPTTIHYCWFGRNPKPKLAEKCIMSWRKFCPDYEIIEWNEDNFDISSAPVYVRQAYEAKKWAYVSDYVRLKVVFDHGGIYLDTDVELLKNLNLLLEKRAYFGFEDGLHINTGLGFGAEKGHPILKELMDEYSLIPFIRSDGTIDDTPCPVRNTECFLRHGLVLNDEKQVLDHGILILPEEYLSPLSYDTGKKRITKTAISIHWYDASWKTDEQKKQHKEKIKAQRRSDFVDYCKHTPNRVAMKLLGNQRYQAIKALIKEGRKT